jgi:acyl-coenzyme A synthetase/AMP-(fatty) acid ligase
MQSLEPFARVVVSTALAQTYMKSHLGNAGNQAIESGIVALDELDGALDVEEQVISKSQGNSRILCYMFTGGTQRTKIVKATHSMLLHERTAYKELWQPRNLPVVLAHTSVYWGASALGQMSIAFAFGGTTVWTEAAEVGDLLKCIAMEGITVLGLVPDHLDLLAPQLPARELPNIEAVFTWGERLPRRLIDRWRGHPRAVLRELLIATEYWLALWADPFENAGVLRNVCGADVLVITDDGSSVGMGELGILCIGGPMVMEGYHVVSERADATNGATSQLVNGQRLFQTSDLVRRVPGGIVYKGRADMMAKHKGKWVDMVNV